VLKNRNVILFPDQGAFEKWMLKAEEIQMEFNKNVFVSYLLELIADVY
jgi:hypothetical protein